MKTLLTLFAIALSLVASPALALDKTAEINTIEFKAEEVDIMSIKIQDGKLWVENHLGSPTRMYVSGRRFAPKWQNKTSEPFTKFDGKFKSFKGAIFKIEVKRGRSKVELDDLPTDANGQTLTVKITDEPNEPSDYFIKITW